MKTQILKNGALIGDGQEKLTMDDKIALEICLGDRRKYVCIVDWQKNITVLKPTRKTPQWESIYHLDIDTFLGRIGEKSFVHTKYPQNGLRVLERQGNKILITEFSVISQHGQIFLVDQQSHFEEIASEGSSVVVPNLKWESLDKILTNDAKEGGENRFGIELRQLRKVKDVPPRKKPVIPELGENQAIVLWYNAAMGSGCAMTNHGQARIWWPNTPITKDGIRMLVEGEIVEFSRLKQIDRSDTNFRLEIIGEVRVVKPENKKISAVELHGTLATTKQEQVNA
ncbi:MAG TPA: hypothetical protein P5230_02450 [Candidatus Magasanikbacteria bacterium]|nr:hypothetical protein [Candidatus Magasanikbacteria bacterium]